MRAWWWVVVGVVLLGAPAGAVKNPCPAGCIDIDIGTHPGSGLPNPPACLCDWHTRVIKPLIDALHARGAFLDRAQTWTQPQTFPAGTTIGGATSTTTTTAASSTTTTAPAGTLYVVPPDYNAGGVVGTADCTPATTGDGTIGNPYRNLYWALKGANSGAGVPCGTTLTLRGGHYGVNTQLSGTPDAQGIYQNTGTAARLDNCSDETATTNAFGATRALALVTKQCTAGSRLTITNYPGETVVLEGTNLDMQATGLWTQCEGQFRCGTVLSSIACIGAGNPAACCTGANTGTCNNLPCTGAGTPYACCTGAGTGSGCAAPFVLDATVGGQGLEGWQRTYYTTRPWCSSGQPQCEGSLWVDATDNTHGKRLGLWSNDWHDGLGTEHDFSRHDDFVEADLAPGQDTQYPIVGRWYGVHGQGTTAIARLADSYVGGGSYDLDAHAVRVVSEPGHRWSASPIVIDGANFVTIERNAGGGTLKIRGGYPAIKIRGNALNTRIAGLDIAAVGSWYGNAVRIENGSFIVIDGNTITEVGGEGIAAYGGGNGSAGQRGIVIENITITNNTIENMGFGQWDGMALAGYGAVASAIKLKNCKNCVVRGNRVKHTILHGIEVNVSASSDSTIGACCPTHVAGVATDPATCSPTLDCRSDAPIIEGNDVQDTGYQALFPSEGGTYPPQVIVNGNDGAGIWTKNAGTAGRIANNMIHYGTLTIAGGLFAGITIEDQGAILGGVNVNGTWTVANNSVSLPYYSYFSPSIPISTVELIGNAFNGTATYPPIRTRGRAVSMMRNNAFIVTTTGDQVLQAITENVSGCGAANLTTSTVTCVDATPTNLTVSPFVSADDLHAAGTALKDKGGAAVAGYTIDFDGQTRAVPWDAGADEVP